MRRAFSLVELLVVIAVLAILVALLLPAVQTARESARKSLCSNNLRQFTLAIQNLESVDEVLPGRAWGTAIRPFMEEGSRRGRTPLSSCPTTPASQIRGRGALDYAVADSLRVDGLDSSWRAAGAGSARSFSEITDGLSKTLFFVEQAGAMGAFVGRPSSHTLGWQSSRVQLEGRLRYKQLGRPTSREGFFYHHEKGPEHSEYSGMEINRRNDQGIYAFHVGAQVSMCDGAVRFMPEGTAPALLAVMFTRDRGDVYENP